MNNVKRTISDISITSEKVVQEMSYYKSLLDPIINTSVTKKDFIKETGNMKLDMKYITDQMLRFHKGIEEINQKHRRQLENGIWEKLEIKLKKKLDIDMAKVSSESSNEIYEQTKKAQRLVRG